MREKRISYVSTRRVTLDLSEEDFEQFTYLCKRRGAFKMGLLRALINADYQRLVDAEARVAFEERKQQKL